MLVFFIFSICSLRCLVSFAWHLAELYRPVIALFSVEGRLVGIFGRRKMTFLGLFFDDNDAQSSKEPNKCHTNNAYM